MDLKDESSKLMGSVNMAEVDERASRDAEQGERLLPQSELGEDSEEVRFKEEWHLRTIWVVIGTLLAVALVFLSMLTFTRTFIVDNAKIEAMEANSFRRAPKDYILDPRWNFNAASTTRRYQWTISDVMANPDGVYRPMLVINGQFPGPMIECNEGDTIVIEVDNQAENATSLHFHGIFQNGTNWMDGTAGVTQCPIASKRKFRYEFTVSGQSGTYYYHGHQAVQASDGLYGPMVIHARHERTLQDIPYVTDRVVMLQDYYHDLSSGLLVAALEPGSETSPIPNGALINGLNKRDCSDFIDRSPSVVCNNSTATLPRFELEANKNHRLRFINVGAFGWFQVSVDGHQFAITEVDGTDIKPSYDTKMMISPAQRYSIVISTDKTHADSFWLRAKMATHCWSDENLPGPGADEAKAIIQYTNGQKSHTEKPLTVETSWNNWEGAKFPCKDMDTSAYIPVSWEPAPAIADHSYYMISNLEIDVWDLERGFFNESSFRPNLQEPTLHRTIDGLASGNDTFSSMSTTDGVNSISYNLKNELVIQHSGIKVVDIIIQNRDPGNHPMHLHGHKFWVLGQGPNEFPGYESLGLQNDGKGLLEGHEGILDNLIRRDVATAEGKGWLALRFVADNPGVWAFHCHMAWHSEAGLVMQFLSRVDEVASWEIPRGNTELCEVSAEELEKGACPKDSTWTGYGSED